MRPCPQWKLQPWFWASDWIWALDLSLLKNVQISQHAKRNKQRVESPFPHQNLEITLKTFQNKADILTSIQLFFFFVFFPECDFLHTINPLIFLQQTVDSWPRLKGTFLMWLLHDAVNRSDSLSFAFCALQWFQRKRQTPKAHIAVGNHNLFCIFVTLWQEKHDTIAFFSPRRQILNSPLCLKASKCKRKHIFNKLMTDAVNHNVPLMYRIRYKVSSDLIS